jgi:hypothetical protein
MFNENSSAPIVTNCILWGDSATLGPEVRNWNGGTPTFSYCDIAGSVGAAAGLDPNFGTDGGGNIDADPRFVDPARGVYWLRADSPAIGKGSSQYAPATDFWGRPRPKDKAPDLGAFPFEPILTGKQVRADWNAGWPYHRHGNKAGLPDPWALPSAEPAKGLR